MRLWILFGCGVLVLAAAIWPSGKRTEQLGTVPATPAFAERTPNEAPKPAAAPVQEVIDLSRAYEPVREAEEPAGIVNPATFIEIPEAPKRIPPAMDLDNPFRDVIEKVQEAPAGSFLFGAPVPTTERLDVMPRVVPVSFRWPSYNLQPYPWDRIGQENEEFTRSDVIWPLGFGPTKYIPYFHGGIEYIQDNREAKGDQLITVRSLGVTFTASSLGRWSQNETGPSQAVDVTPHVVPASFVVKSPDGCVLLSPPGLEGKCQRAYPLERVKAMPREALVSVTQPVHGRLLDFALIPAASTSRQLVFTPGVPYVGDISRDLAIQNGLLNFTPTGTESLTVMPRVVKQSD